MVADATVLIVDDDRTIVRLCQRVLERASYQVFTALDPLDALKILERQHVDLLLSDIRMPVMDGFELIMRAKQIQPNLPVLVMTGYGSIDNAIEALHGGVEGLILKPFENTAALVRATQRVLEESRQRRDDARLHVLRPLFNVTENLLAQTSPQLLEKQILNAVNELFQAYCAGIYRLNAEKTSLVTVRATESFLTESADVLNQRLFNQMLESETPLIISASDIKISHEARGVFDEMGLQSMMFASVLRNNSTFFFCACRLKGSESFTEADLEMFVILARQAGVAMENARLYSELKENVRRVEESQRALIQAEKMAAVGRLVASLAHEINNPLQAVRNSLHLAGRKGLPLTKRAAYLQMAEKELDRLDITVRRMLDFYRPGRTEIEKIALPGVIDQVLAILRPQLEEQGMQVIVQVSGDSREVNLVPGQIQQVIFNLLLNAMDAVEDAAQGSEVVQPETDKKIWIDIIFNNDQVRVLIEDSGAGVPVELRERIFEPFVSTKQHGTGLGLAVSYGIMERHHGTIRIIPSRYKEGACFEMTLPLGVDAQDGDS